MRKYEEAHKEHINKYKMAHMIGVAEYMRERAVDYGINPDAAYTIGLLHDIGYLNGRVGHEEVGYEILSSLGVNENISFAILHHGEMAYEVYDKYGKDSISPEFVLLLEADTSVNAQGYRVGFDGRMEDIINRYGVSHPAIKTVHNNIEFIKEYQQEHGIGKPYDLYHKNRHWKENCER